MNQSLCKPLASHSPNHSATLHCTYGNIAHSKILASTIRRWLLLRLPVHRRVTLRWRTVLVGHKVVLHLSIEFFGGLPLRTAARLATTSGPAVTATRLGLGRGLGLRLGLTTEECLATCHRIQQPKKLRTYATRSVRGLGSGIPGARAASTITSIYHNISFCTIIIIE